MIRFRIEQVREAVDYLRVMQRGKKCDCPYMVVVYDRMIHGSTLFAKGDVLCTKNGLQVCCVYRRRG